MTIPELLSTLPRGGSLYLDGDRIRYAGPPLSLTVELRRCLVEHKTDLLAYLRQGNAVLPSVTVTDELEQALRQAPTWADLETALERAQAAYQAGELTANQVEALAILAAQEAQALPETTEGLRLSHLFKEQPVRRVFSKILDEVVVFAADSAQVPADGPGIVYRESELRQLVGCTPERLRAVHLAKYHLDGELLDGPGAAAILPVEELLADGREPSMP